MEANRVEKAEERTGVRDDPVISKDLDPRRILGRVPVTPRAQHGIIAEPVRIDPSTNKKFTFFSDPDGLPIELHER